MGKYADKASGNSKEPQMGKYAAMAVAGANNPVLPEEEYPQETSDYAKKIAGKALDVATNTPGGLLRYASTPVRAAFRPNGEPYLDTIANQGGVDNLLKAIKGEYPGTPELLESQGVTPGMSKLIGLSVDFATDPTPFALQRLGDAAKIGKYGVKNLGKRLRLNALESLEPGLSKALPEGWGALATKSSKEADKLWELNKGVIEANKNVPVNMSQMFDDIKNSIDTDVVRNNPLYGTAALDEMTGGLDRVVGQKSIVSPQIGPPTPYMENLGQAKVMVKKQFKDPANAAYSASRREGRVLNAKEESLKSANRSAENSLGSALGGAEGAAYLDRNKKMGTLINAAKEGGWTMPSRFSILTNPKYAGLGTLGAIGLAGAAGGNENDRFNYGSAMDAAMLISLLYGAGTPQGRSTIGRAMEKLPITRSTTFGINRLNSPWNDVNKEGK